MNHVSTQHPARPPQPQSLFLGESFQAAMDELEMTALAVAALHCRAEHEERLRECEENLAREWLSSNDPERRKIGEALASGDLSHLTEE